MNTLHNKKIQAQRWFMSTRKFTERTSTTTLTRLTLQEQATISTCFLNPDDAIKVVHTGFNHKYWGTRTCTDTTYLHFSPLSEKQAFYFQISLDTNAQQIARNILSKSSSLTKRPGDGNTTKTCNKISWNIG